MLLAGDIGGTKTVLALYTENSSPTAPFREVTFPSTRYQSLEQIIDEFLGSNSPGQEPVSRAAFGVAGPVVGGKATLPNLPWVIDDSELIKAFEFESAAVVNDLEAIGHAVPVLEQSDLATIKEGIPEPRGSIAVIAPGTGLGETFASWEGNRFTVHPSEGGHADFAPVDDFQLGLLEYLLERFDHVSYERVCSGTGIPNIYDYIKESGTAEEPGWLAEELARAEDPNAVIISNAAEERSSCRICALTAETFVSILAAEAGNMVLRCLATGGLFLGGGIPPRIIPLLQKPNFLRWFVQKGRLSRLPERVPVRVILNSKVALIGAASLGLRQTAAG